MRWTVFPDHRQGGGHGDWGVAGWVIPWWGGGDWDRCGKVEAGLD